MRIPEKCRLLLLAAEGKALATYSPESGPHVVPVSSLLVEGDTIILVNYFFKQTLANIVTNPVVSLAAWKGLEGYQYKATARYETSGQQFETVVAWIVDTIPGRVVHGILILTPTEIFTVSAGLEAGQTVLAE